MSKLVIENYQDALDILSKRVDCVTFSMRVPPLDYDILITEEEYRQQCLEDNYQYSQEDLINIRNGQKEFVKLIENDFKILKDLKEDILFTQYSKNYGPIIYNEERLIIGFKFSNNMIKFLKTLPSFFSNQKYILDDLMFYEKGKLLLATYQKEKLLLLYDEFIYLSTEFNGYQSKFINRKYMYKFPYKLNNDGNVVLSSKEVRAKYLNSQKVHD